jgi:hypothetical protein
MADPTPTGLRDNYPITLDSVQYAPFKTWDVSYADSVTTHETESGKQEDTVVRKGRRVIRASTTCTDTVAAQLAALNDKDYFSATFFDIKTGTSITTDVRVRAGSMSISLVPKSADLTAVNGLYSVSFNLEEF